MTVDPKLACAHHALDVAEREAGKPRFEKTVDAHAVLIGFDRDVLHFGGQRRRCGLCVDEGLARGFAFVRARSGRSRRAAIALSRRTLVPARTGRACGPAFTGLRITVGRARTERTALAAFTRL
ncbi:MAG: hypothetical protein J0H62_09475, partial [Rhizobiales bacterium]|nr:hypothetical protein [Hyphomicrobiales bacterium]